MPTAPRLVRSGDAVADAQYRATSIKSYEDAERIVQANAARAQLQVGKDGWPMPMPIPLVKTDAGKWYFDTRQGEAEILRRRIGENELSAMQVCLAIVDAQRDFTARDADGDGLREYAAQFNSSPGKRDGLFWPAAENDAISPLGPTTRGRCEGRSQALMHSPHSLTMATSIEF